MDTSPPTIRNRPNAVARWFYNFPVHMHRARVGWLLGSRLIVLVHRGPRTGDTRRTALEVYRTDPATGERFVLSGRGVGSDWYRNIEAEPALELWAGRHRHTVDQRSLEPGEAKVEFRRYVDIHPRLAKKVMAELGAPGDFDNAADRIRIISFRPTGDA